MPGTLRSFLLFRYAQFLAVFGLRARALEFLELLLQGEPDHHRALTVSAFLHAQYGRYEAAIRKFGRAVELKPGDADSLFNLGFSLQQVGRHEEAISQFEHATKANPNLDRAWYGMGISLDKLGRYEEAAEKFKEAARIQPFNPYAGYHLASAWFKLGRRDMVEAEYQRIKGFDPKVAAQMERDFGAGRS
jgi:tetratricopeptide (TPR) repeat protein